MDYTPHSIKTGYWCSTCAGNNNDPVYQSEKIVKVLDEMGWTWLAGEYVNSSTKIYVTFNEGHKFWSSQPTLSITKHVPDAQITVLIPTIKQSW